MLLISSVWVAALNQQSSSVTFVLWRSTERLYASCHPAALHHNRLGSGGLVAHAAEEQLQMRSV